MTHKNASVPFLKIIDAWTRRYVLIICCCFYGKLLPWFRFEFYFTYVEVVVIPSIVWDFQFCRVVCFSAFCEAICCANAMSSQAEYIWTSDLNKLCTQTYVNIHSISRETVCHSRLYKTRWNSLWQSLFIGLLLQLSCYFERVLVPEDMLRTCRQKRFCSKN